MSKSINFTEQELKKILIKNPKLKISQELGANSKIILNKSSSTEGKIKFDEVVKKKSKSSGSIKTSEINKLNKEAPYECNISDDHFSILFKGARLITINQIFSMLEIEKRRYELFSYKKTWHNLITKILYEQKIQNKQLPFFDCPVEITVFRQAPKLVDRDAVSIMFKYIIDAFKRNSKDNPYGIIAEDNPQIVTNIIPQSEKGKFYVGIRIKKTPNQLGVFSPHQILEKD